jgi:cytochrome c oxidase assembly protein subunit 15
MFGHLIPDHWDPKIAVHFAHRVGALIVVFSVIATSAHIWYHHPTRSELTRPASLMLLLVASQVTLGALTVLSQRDVWINSVHLVNGALVLATSIVITLRSWQARFAESVRLKPDATSVVVKDVRGVRLQADHGWRP